MPQISLLLQPAPSQAKIVCNAATRDGGHEKIVAIIDTGAAACFFPRYMLDILEAEDLIEVELEQAGIGSLSIPATEATIKLRFEDANGKISAYQATRVWFAETEISLIGFDGVLDRSVLHIDMPAHDGWLQIS